MAEFVYAKHKGIEGLAYLSKDALESDQFPGWAEATEKEIEAETKPKSSRAVKTD